MRSPAWALALWQTGLQACTPQATATSEGPRLRETPAGLLAAQLLVHPLWGCRDLRNYSATLQSRHRLLRACHSQLGVAAPATASPAGRGAWACSLKLPETA